MVSGRERRPDRALAAACLAFVVVPNLVELRGGERTERYDTVVTPPAYAFAVWAPIFAACATDAVARLRSDEAQGDRSSAWPLAGAYTLNTAWSVAAGADRFALTPALLPPAAALTGLAHRRLQAVDRPRTTTTLAAGLLLGWTVLAGTVNVAADAVRRGARPGSRTTVALSTAGLATAAALLLRVVTDSRHGAAAVATTGSWGLLTTALDPRRPRSVRTVAGLGGGALIAALVRLGRCRSGSRSMMMELRSA